MGDMADMLIEQGYDEKFDADYDIELNYSRIRRPVECYHCGSVPLKWAFVDNRWQLYNKQGQRHQCNIQDIIRHKNVKSFLVPKLSNIPYLQWAAALKFYKVT